MLSVPSHSNHLRTVCEACYPYKNMDSLFCSKREKKSLVGTLSRIYLKMSFGSDKFNTYAIFFAYKRTYKNNIF